LLSYTGGGRLVGQVTVSHVLSGINSAFRRAHPKRRRTSIFLAIG
jgi:hypothetical protein